MAIIDVQCDICGEEFRIDEHGHENGWFLCGECKRNEIIDAIHGHLGQDCPDESRF